jgi:hypothetical protein
LLAVIVAVVFTDFIGTRLTVPAAVQALHRVA